MDFLSVAIHLSIIYVRILQPFYIYPSICLSIHKNPSIHLSRQMQIHLLIYLCMYLSIYLSIYLSMYLIIYAESYRFSTPLNLVIQNCQRWFTPQAGKPEYFLWEPSVLEISSSPAPNRSPFPPSYYWWDKRQWTSCYDSSLIFPTHRFTLPFSNTYFYFTILYHSLPIPTIWTHILSTFYHVLKEQPVKTPRDHGEKPRTATPWGTSSFSSGCRISSRSVSKPWGLRRFTRSGNTIPPPETQKKHAQVNASWKKHTSVVKVNQVIVYLDKYI